jgi:uncharacterized protein YktA (UPF0223 family)
MDSSLFLKNAADKCGFNRVKYDSNKVPTSIDDDTVSVFSFFGDMRSIALTSSLIMKRYKEEIKASKYFILCSWPGYEKLFPYVDEYWSIREESVIKSVYRQTDGMKNRSDLVLRYERNLNHFFVDHSNFRDIETFYNNGIQKHFFDKLKNIKKFIPAVSSAAVLGSQFVREMGKSKGYKVFIYPTYFARHFKSGKINYIDIDKQFWVGLIEALLAEGFHPVVYNDKNTFDISGDFVDRCLYISDSDISHVLAAMRSTGLVIDFYSGISRLAILARCPFVAFDERNRYSASKEFEFDDLVAEGIPREYIFAFPTILGHRDLKSWKVNVFDVLISKLNDLIPNLNRDNWPSTSEVNEIVPYSRVREVKNKRFGSRFIKIPKV